MGNTSQGSSSLFGSIGRGGTMGYGGALSRNRTRQMQSRATSNPYSNAVKSPIAGIQKRENNPSTAVSATQGSESRSSSPSLPPSAIRSNAQSLQKYKNDNFLAGMDQPLPDGPFNRAQDAWSGSYSGIYNQDGGMTGRSEFAAGEREGLGIVGGILDSEQQGYQKARNAEKNERGSSAMKFITAPWEVAEADIKGDGYVTETRAREKAHKNTREAMEQPTPFNQGLYKDTQYGITFTDKAQRTGFTGNFEEWKSKQRFKYMSAVTREMRRKRDNKRLGLDEDYGSERSRAAQIAARKEMPEVNNAPNG